MKNDSLKFKNKKYIILLSAVCCLLSCCFVLTPEEVIADNFGNYGLDDTLQAESEVNGQTVKPANVFNDEKDIPTTVGTVIGAALAFIGVLFFILMIYGGYLWMTARGNEQEIEKAKNLITAAIIGLIIVMSAYAITAYIGGVLTTS